MKTRKLPHNIGIVSLGCAKNLVDTEVLMKQLSAEGMKLILDPSGSDRIDTAIINTCGFILDAKQESVDSIMNFVRLKKEGKLSYLFVMGCLSERYRNELKEEIPEVDDFFGVNELQKIVERVGARFRKELLGQRIITTPSHLAWLKIAEGCDRRCSFCSIPHIRGKHISKPVEVILDEAANLVAQGVKEINVISQETSYYGVDLYKERKIAELMAKLASVKGLEWIRLHYTHPDGFPDELIDVIRDHPNICNYVDIPLQHISQRILKSMKRGINARETRNLIRKIRERIPGVTMRTTFITGYPGETDAEHRELIEFIREARFDRLGVFSYSEEEGTAAAKLKDNVPESVKTERMEEIMALQEEISFDLNQQKVGTILRVVVDRREGDFFVARTEGDSPEIDNEVLIPGDDETIVCGCFYNVRITSADTFDLFGQISQPEKTVSS